MQLTDHFSLDEFTHSNTAESRGMDNSLPPSLLTNAIKTCELLEEIRSLLGDNPIEINSGYRSERLNVAIGGVATSEHCKGMAADFVCPGYGTPKEICEAIEASTLEWGQLIFEGSWVHISIPSRRHSQEVMTMRGGKYFQGIV